MSHTLRDACLMLLRAFLACGALFLHQTCAVFRSKPRDFGVENFEKQRDRSCRRAQNDDNTLERSFDAYCAGRAGYPELCNLFCTEICGKTSRFSLEIAEVSMKFDALFAHNTRRAPSKYAQTSQACVTRCAVHVRFACARFYRMART